jgi:hypothetical protein
MSKITKRPVSDVSRKKCFRYNAMHGRNFTKLFMIKPKSNITYKNTVLMMSVPPKERLPVILR